MPEPKLICGVCGGEGTEEDPLKLIDIGDSDFQQKDAVHQSHIDDWAVAYKKSWQYK